MDGFCEFLCVRLGRWREPAGHRRPYRIAGGPVRGRVTDADHGSGRRLDRDHTAALVETPELVARATNGDQVAWDQLVERYGGMVWAVARAHGLAAHDASDVSQVTWLLLVQHLGLDPAARAAGGLAAQDRHPRGIPHAQAARLRGPDAGADDPGVTFTTPSPS